MTQCAASQEVKKRTGQLVNLAFSARHIGISIWALTQKITSITASFRENVAVIVPFCTPSAKTTKAIFDEYAGELSQDEYKGLISKVKELKFSYLVFSLRHPFGVEFYSRPKAGFLNKKNESCYIYCVIAATVINESHNG